MTIKYFRSFFLEFPKLCLETKMCKQKSDTLIWYFCLPKPDYMSYVIHIHFIVLSFFIYIFFSYNIILYIYLFYLTDLVCSGSNCISSSKCSKWLKKLQLKQKEQHPRIYLSVKFSWHLWSCQTVKGYN